MMLSARNAVVALGGLVRFGAPAGEMAGAVAKTGEAVRKHLEKDPGETLMFPLLDARATALSEVVQQRGDLKHLYAEDRANRIEEAYEIYAARDAADAWLLGAAALIRWFPTGNVRMHLERARERGVAAIARFDRALDPALRGLSPLRDAAKKAVILARSDRGYVRRVYYWARIIETETSPHVIPHGPQRV